LVLRLVEWNWGPGALDLAPEIRFAYGEAEKRAQEIESVRTAVELGLDVPKSHVRDLLGIPEPEEGEEILEPQGGGGEGPFGMAGRQECPPHIEGKPWLR